LRVAVRDCGLGRRARHDHARQGDLQRLRAARRNGLSEKICEGLAQGSGRFIHGLTYSGNPVSCFVGLKVHEIMRREHLFTRTARIGAYLKAGLLELADEHAMIGEVRGRGLLCGIELVADRRNRMSFDPSLGIARRVVQGMRKRGVVIAQGLAGTGDQLQLSPPFTIAEAEVDLLLGALDETPVEIARSLPSG
jgi:adenosylmethionine-8-amino-7-oxononanoate aminotransferase